MFGITTLGGFIVIRFTPGGVLNEKGGFIVTIPLPK
jgi:hypothetical protein